MAIAVLGTIELSLGMQFLVARQTSIEKKKAVMIAGTTCNIED